MKEEKQLYFLFEMMLDENEQCYCYNPLKDNMSDMDPDELNRVGSKLLEFVNSNYKIRINEISSVLVDNDNLKKIYFNFYHKSHFIEMLTELHDKFNSDYSLDKFISNISNKFSKNIKKVFFDEGDKQLIEIKISYTIDKETLEIIFNGNITLNGKINNSIFMILITYISYIVNYKEENQRLYFISMCQYWKSKDNKSIKFKTFDIFTCNVLDKLFDNNFKLDDDTLIEYLDFLTYNYNKNLNLLLYERREYEIYDEYTQSQLNNLLN